MDIKICINYVACKSLSPLSLGMYDVFQNFDPEKKKLICRTVRYLAHSHGATLQFYSAMDSGLVKKARDLLSHHAFDSPPAKGVSQDYNKPLIIPAGSDAFQAILGVGEVPKLEVMKHQFSTHFPQEETETLTMSEDPAKDSNFRVSFYPPRSSVISECRLGG